MLPGDGRDDANEWVTVAIPTGIGELRNGLIVRTADAMVAVGGAYGTLSEIALGSTQRSEGLRPAHLGHRGDRAV